MTLARAEPGGPAPPWGVRETRASCSRRGGGLGTLQIFPRRVVTLCSFGLCISALLRIRPSRAFFNPAYWRIRGTPFYPISGTEMALLKAAPERREHLSILSDIYARPLCRPVQRQKKRNHHDCRHCSELCSTNYSPSVCQIPEHRFSFERRLHRQSSCRASHGVFVFALFSFSPAALCRVYFSVRRER